MIVSRLVLFKKKKKKKCESNARVRSASLRAKRANSVPVSEPDPKPPDPAKPPDRGASTSTARGRSSVVVAPHATEARSQSRVRLQPPSATRAGRSASRGKSRDRSSSRSAGVLQQVMSQVTGFGRDRSLGRGAVSAAGSRSRSRARSSRAASSAPVAPAAVAPPAAARQPSASHAREVGRRAASACGMQGAWFAHELVVSCLARGQDIESRFRRTGCVCHGSVTMGNYSNSQSPRRVLKRSCQRAGGRVGNRVTLDLERCFGTTNNDNHPSTHVRQSIPFYSLGCREPGSRTSWWCHVWLEDKTLSHGSGVQVAFVMEALRWGTTATPRALVGS